MHYKYIPEDLHKYNIHPKYHNYIHHLLGGATENEENKTNDIPVLTPEELISQWKKLTKKDKQTFIDELSLDDRELFNEEKERDKEKRKKMIEYYNIENIKKYLKTQDGKLLESGPGTKDEINTNIIYDDEPKFLNEEWRNKAQDHQKKFIDNWSISTQEVVILYYGVGTGKTFIAVNCAEFFQYINNDAFVYFLLPASLVFNMIKEMYIRGIDPRRKHENGKYIYNFISYQQFIRSKLDFEENGLLIVDEAHNLRNLRTKDEFEKVSARKRAKTGKFKLQGSIIANNLMTAKNKFVRTILMTGTLCVNSPDDLVGLISVGFKSKPLLNADINEYLMIQNDELTFKNYYQGLISSHFNPADIHTPKINYNIIPIYDDFNVNSVNAKKDAYFSLTRNYDSIVDKKEDWIISFLLKNKNKKTLIYSQFLNILPGDNNILIEDDEGNTTKKMISTRFKTKLDNTNLKYAVISGELSALKKSDLVNKYNKGEIKILFFTLAIKEGISFKYTDNFIIMQPYWNYSILSQVIARAIRFKSHGERGRETSTVKVYLLSHITKDDNTDNEEIAQLNNVMNVIQNTSIKDINTDEIKKYFGYTQKILEGKNEEKQNYIENAGSRDIHLYKLMIIKQLKINVFEKRLLDLPNFENVNDIHNNLFTETYNALLIDADKEGKLTKQQQLALKKQAYKSLYDKQLTITDNKITRLNSVMNELSQGKGPNLEENFKLTKNDEISILNKIRSGDYTLSELFAILGITKKEITQFQAFFTPLNICSQLIKYSNINKDTRINIKILEPTAGIGNMITELNKLSNKSSFVTDCIEYNEKFFKVAETVFEKLDNIKWTRMDFMDYVPRFKYDYIIGNPPFNISYEQKIYSKKNELDDNGNLLFKTVKKNLFDIHFAARAYNMLEDGGILCMVISDAFIRKKETQPYNIFNAYLDKIEWEYSNSDHFTVENTLEGQRATTDIQNTKWNMIMIKMIKKENFTIDMSNIYILKPNKEASVLEQIKFDKNIKKEYDKNIEVIDDNLGKTKKLKRVNKKIDKLIKDVTKETEMGASQNSINDTNNEIVRTNRIKKQLQYDIDNSTKKIQEEKLKKKQIVKESNSEPIIKEFKSKPPPKLKKLIPTNNEISDYRKNEISDYRKNNIIVY